MSKPKYPQVKVRLSGQDGNAFMIIGRVSNALRKAKVPDAEVKAFRTQATAGDYNNVLRTCLAWVNVE